MPKYKSHLLFCALLLFGLASANAQQVPAAIFTDPAPDKEFPATMEAPDIMSHGSRLNAIIYIASGRGPHPTLLLMHGFPGNEKNLDLAYAARRAGWNVLIPHYRGSWGSTGNFSHANAIQDTQSATQFLRDVENAKKFRIDTKRIVLVGHSMGGFMVAYGAAHDPDVAGLIMISAMNIGNGHPPITERTDSLAAGSQRLVGATPADLLKEAVENAAKWDYLTYGDLLKSRPVLILESDDRNKSDNHAMAEALKKAGNARVTEIHIETDHTYSGHRIALQAAVLEWLQTAFPPAAK